MARAEDEVACQAMVFKRLNKLVVISLHVIRLNVWIGLKAMKVHCDGCLICNCNYVVSYPICGTISCEQRIFPSITTVEHFDTLCIPVFNETMVAIQLHLIFLAVVVSLKFISSKVNILGVLIPNILHEDGRCVWFQISLFNKIIETFILLPVPLVQ